MVLGTLALSLKLPGEPTESGVGRRAEKLFTVRVDAWGEGAVLLVLSTYADAWLTLDLRERPQPEVAAENAPRLATALKRISEPTGAEIDPGFGAPEALEELLGDREDGQEGSAVESTAHEAASLDALEELSGRF
ncbi:hypothetical protein [Streptomyces goshikiensis]|uniref:hypothetical protein n=1 Tax=Streptomyces goshikiensis TaxID=1942 RepID=UPI003684601E